MTHDEAVRLNGKRIVCTYAGKVRRGVVEKVERDYLRIEYNIPGTDKPQYRSLKFNGIQGLKVE